MNWGLRIIILYVGFVIMILTFVFMSTKQKRDLVRTDYYAEELRHQEKIDKQRNAEFLSELPKVNRGEKNLSVVFPAEQHGKNLSGTITFYRPSDASLDRKVTVSPDSSGIQLVNEELKTGMYHVQIDWICDGRSYYSESTLNIP